jgi:hypothetical protein
MIKQLCSIAFKIIMEINILIITNTNEYLNNNKHKKGKKTICCLALACLDVRPSSLKSADCSWLFASGYPKLIDVLDTDSRNVDFSCFHLNHCFRLWFHVGELYVFRQNVVSVQYLHLKCQLHGPFVISLTAQILVI